MSQNDTLIYPSIDFKRKIGGEENSMHSEDEQEILNITIVWAQCKRHYLPPGTGVIQLALFLASAKCTSPRRRRPLFLVSSEEDKKKNSIAFNLVTTMQQMIECEKLKWPDSCSFPYRSTTKSRGISGLQKKMFQPLTEQIMLHDWTVNIDFTYIDYT